jgi:membrane protein YqaA with SNARE-associated domain
MAVRPREVPMPAKPARRVPWFLWPFYAVWRLLTFVLEAVGRVLCAVLGVALMAVGLVVSLTVVGAPLGVPLSIVGFLLLVRAFF